VRSLIANKLTTIWKEAGEACLDDTGKSQSLGIETRQQIYLLRHYPVLLHEYYLMARLAIQEKWLVPPWRLFSFKCGSATDYEAFYAAASEENIDSFTYTGIDDEIWGSQSGVPPNKLKVIWAPPANLPGGELADINLMVFPKSLKDFSSHEFGAISQHLQKGNMTRKRICMAFSASHPEQPEFELNRFHSLLEQVSRWQKYRICKEQTIHFQAGSACKYADDRFEYPQRILKKLRERKPASSFWPVERLEQAFIKAVFLEAR
jgi:hypothetical protein